jgi:hypothetical protein
MAQSSNPGQQRGPGLKLEDVDAGAFGCGCSLSRNSVEARKLKFLVVSPMDDATYIKLNGEKIKMHLVASSKRRTRERVGDRSWEKYAAGNVTMRIDYVVTRVCGPKEEGCEVTNYRAVLTVSRGAQTVVVKGIADCGC